MTGYAAKVRCDRLIYTAPGADQNWVSATAAALNEAMIALGWRGVPGSPALVGDDWLIDVESRLRELSQGVISPAQWQAGCRAAGIDMVEIVLPAIGAAGVAAPAKDRREGFLRQKVPNVAVFVVLAILLVQLGFIAFGDASGAGSGSNASSNPNESYPDADGASNLPGGFVRLSYKPSGHDWETVKRPDNKRGTLDHGAWWLDQGFPGTVAHYGVITNYMSSPLKTPRLTKLWIAEEDKYNSTQSGSKVGHTDTRVDGRDAYTWEFREQPAKWVRKTWVLRRTRSYVFMCTAAKATPAQLRRIKARCDKVIATAKFQPGA